MMLQIKTNIGILTSCKTYRHINDNCNSHLQIKVTINLKLNNQIKKLRQSLFPHFFHIFSAILTIFQVSKTIF